MVKEIYQIKKDELLSNVDVSKGLTRKKKKKRLEQDGENVLKETERKSVLSVFLV